MAADGGSADAEAGVAPSTTAGSGNYKLIKVTTEGGLYSITLNRPDKKNALTREVGFVFLILYY